MVDSIVPKADKHNFFHGLLQLWFDEVGFSARSFSAHSGFPSLTLYAYTSRQFIILINYCYHPPPTK